MKFLGLNSPCPGRDSSQELEYSSEALLLGMLLGEVIRRFHEPPLPSQVLRQYLPPDMSGVSVPRSLFTTQL